MLCWFFVSSRSVGWAGGGGRKKKKKKKKRRYKEVLKLSLGLFIAGRQVGAALNLGRAWTISGGGGGRRCTALPLPSPNEARGHQPAAAAALPICTHERHLNCCCCITGWTDMWVVSLVVVVVAVSSALAAAAAASQFAPRSRSSNSRDKIEQ